MNATVVSTGEEIVRGRTLDTNAAFLASELAVHGFTVRRLVAVGDEPDVLRDQIVAAARDSQVVLVTGGLGPTADDRTRVAIAGVVGADLVEDPDARQRLVKRLRSFGREPTRRHLAQAMFPAGAAVFPNHNGTAPGFACRVGEAWVVAMPGVPTEMQPMFVESVLPFLLAELGRPGCFAAEVVHIFPAAESEVDERITDLTRQGRNPSVGLTVRDGVISVSVAARAPTQEEADRLAAADLAALQEWFGERLWGRGRETLASALSARLEAEGMTIAVAESVTGGLVGHMLVDVPAISRFFLADVVAYSNEAKVRQLGVPPELIERYGSVSPQVAAAMAHGVCELVGSDVGVSTTGIAGPSGGSREKPVGLVYLGVCLRGETRVVRLNLRGDRWRVKDRAAKHALNLARLALLNGLASLPSSPIM